MTDPDLAQADLAELLRILGMGDHARPESPHAVFQEALGVLRSLKERAADLEAALVPFAAILKDGEPVGPIPRGLLDRSLTRADLKRAATLLHGTFESGPRWGLVR